MLALPPHPIAPLLRAPGAAALPPAYAPAVIRTVQASATRTAPCTEDINDAPVFGGTRRSGRYRRLRRRRPHLGLSDLPVAGHLSRACAICVMLSRAPPSIVQPALRAAQYGLSDPSTGFVWCLLVSWSGTSAWQPFWPAQPDLGGGLAAPGQARSNPTC